MAEVDTELQELTARALAALADAHDEARLEAWHNEYLGRRGSAISAPTSARHIRRST